MPVLSIIVPCYNHEKYIRECLKSIKYQSFEDYEVIILNDRSKDKTGEAIKTFLNENGDPRFHYYKNEINLGATRNFNKGLHLSKGEYIAFIAGDDYWDRNFIETLMKIILDKKVEYAFCQTALTNDLNNHLAFVPDESLQLTKSEDIYYTMLTGNIIGGHSIVFRRDFLKKHGYFNEKYIYYSDWEFFLRLTKHFNGLYVPQKLAYYRIHDNNMVFRQFTDDITFSELKMLLEAYVLNENLEIPSKKNIVLINLLHFAASCLYNYNYRLVKEVIIYGKKLIGFRIFLVPKLFICYLLALTKSKMIVNVISRLRNKKKGHI